MKRLVYCFLLLLLPGFAQAQEAAPWPPDPADIFAPGVEVVSVEIKEPRPYNLPTVDNERRVIRVFDKSADEWREYPFPDEVERFSSQISSYSENTLLLSTVLGGEYGFTPLPEGQWLLNTDTGEFFRPELVCGQLQAKPGMGRWVIYPKYNQQTPPYLCNTKTGDRAGPLILEQFDYLEDVYALPDARYAVIFGIGGTVYGYDFQTNLLIRLGSVSGSAIHITEWIDETRVFIYATDQADMTFPWQNYYLGDVTQADSLEQVTQVFKPNYITLRDNPKRYEWVSYKDQRCYLTELNWETDQITDYPLNGLCSEGTIIPDGSNDRLYFEFYWPDNAFGMGYPIKQPTSSELVRYNPFTGTRIDLLNGEIEWVEAISPDGLSAAVIMDDNDCFEAYPREDPLENLPPCESNEVSEPRHVVIDLKTGDTLYEQPTEWLDNGDGHHWHFCYDHETQSIRDYCTATLSAGPIDSLIPIGDQLLIEVRRVDSEVEYSFLDLRDEEPQKQVLDEVDALRYLPESQQFLLTLGSSFSEYGITSAEWELYDISTDTRFPFVQDTTRNQYVILFGESTADSMSVTVFPPGGWKNGQLDSVERYIYTVRFPKIRD